MLIHSANQILTLAGGPQKGARLGRLGILEDGAIYIEDGRIAAVGPSGELRRRYAGAPEVDAIGRVALPGFVDPHTHVIWAGDRAAEFELRLEGKAYLEILAAGGGILSTVRATRRASPDDLIEQTRARLRRMLQHGTTTVEAKTGYGLDQETELKMLAVLLALAQEGPWELAITYLAAHAVPPEYENRSDEYAQEIATRWLPQLVPWWREHAAGQSLPFVDVFCETGAFTVAQTEGILQAAKDLGFQLKVHSDEFDNLGGTRLAAGLGAVSADHLVAASDDDIRALVASGTVAVALPGTPFGLGLPGYAPAGRILAAGGTLALASDLNPGTSWCENMQMAIALACRSMKLTPAQAIAAATINAAAAIGWQDRVGSLEIGKQADILLLDVPDYRHLGYRYGVNLVGTVIKRGQIVFEA
ncbi:MAG: imidazolonepropionase [Chloroflexi bacterium]|nr:imidazolonepropionase [Chloroflexota bacterium]